MRRIFLHSRVPLLGALLLASSSSQAQSPTHVSELPTLHIQLRLEQEPQLRLGVDVTVVGEQDGETVFQVSETWGGVVAPRVDLQAPQARGAAGRALEVHGESGLRWTVRHEPGELLTLGAWLLPNERRQSGDSADHYRPLLEPDLFQAIGHLFLPLPEAHDREEQSVALTLSFEGFEEADWELVHSLGLGTNTVRTKLTRERVAGLLFCAGDLALETREIRGGQIAVSLDNNSWAFDAADFADLVAEIIELERNFLDDDSESFYFVSAVSVGDPQARGYSFGGTGLTNSFALFLQPNTLIAADSPVGPQIRKLLAHECFHEWNGLRIRLADPEEQNYWFSEGFTEFFARRILHEAGLLNDDAYLAMLNATLRDYHTSAARNLPASELARIFWTDRTAQQQPYLRGELMAMRIEHAIRARSGGRRDLANFMQALLAECDADAGLALDTDGLLRRLGAECGPQLLPELRAMCVDGETVILPADVLGESFVLREIATYTFEAGFDVNASVAARRITGLEEGSAAQLAGLREGDEVLGLNMQPGRTDVPTKLTVRTGGDGAARDVEYFPRGAEIRLPEVRKAGN